MKKKKSFTLTAVFVALVVVLNNLLNFMLVQPGLTRVMFHELETTNPDCQERRTAVMGLQPMNWRAGLMPVP